MPGDQTPEQEFSSAIFGNMYRLGVAAVLADLQPSESWNIDQVMARLNVAPSVIGEVRKELNTLAAQKLLERIPRPAKQGYVYYEMTKTSFFVSAKTLRDEFAARSRAAKPELPKSQRPTGRPLGRRKPVGG